MQTVLVSLLYLISSSILPQALATNETCAAQKSPDEVLGKVISWEADYSKRIRPNLAQQLKNKSNQSRAEPDIVYLHMEVISIKNINLRSNEFEATVHFSQRWHDYRLAYNRDQGENCSEDEEDIPVGFSEKDSEHIWQPNVILRNAVDEVEILNSVLWIYGNGTVELSRTYISKSSCELDLTRFPYDTQTCKMLYGSWKADFGDISLNYDEQDCIKIVKYDDIYPSAEEWNILGGSVSPYIFPGKGPQVTFSVTMERESQYYFQFVIVPVLLMIIISWSSLFINRGAAPARVTLSIICFLTISNFISNQFIALPKLPSQVWLLRFMEMSLAFAFIPVVEYVACNYLYRVERRLDIVRKAVSETKMIEIERSRLDSENAGGKRSSYLNSYRNVAVEVTKNDMVSFGVCKIDSLFLGHNGNMRLKDQHIDIFFRWMYPIAYAITLGALVGLIR